MIGCYIFFQFSLLSFQVNSTSGLNRSAPATNNTSGSKPVVFSPLSTSGNFSSTPQGSKGTRINYKQNEYTISINSAGQASGGVTSQSFSLLLGPPHHEDRHKPCLIIDLDETLVHSSFKPIPHADFIVPVEIDGTIYQVNFVSHTNFYYLVYLYQGLCSKTTTCG